MNPTALQQPPGKALLIPSALLQDILNLLDKVKGAVGEIAVAQNADGSISLSLDSKVRAIARVNGGLLPVFVPMRATGEAALPIA